MTLDSAIRLDHGSGGKLSRRLIEELFVPYFANPALLCLDDSAVLDMPANRFAFTTDSYVVDPIFFPGGDIGRLAVCGTVNDLSMSGAEPKFLSAGFIIEEGFLTADLERIIISMKEAAEEAGVLIVTGDTKVVQKGKADKLFINTAGVGVIPDGVLISANRAQAGDAVIISGTIGEHGIAVLSQREGMNFQADIQSDTAPLNAVIADLIRLGVELHSLRDPTRGGLAATLNEFASQSKVGIVIEEHSIPVLPSVRSVCNILGFDPLYIANEGKFAAVLPEHDAEKALAVIKRNKYGRNAARIGRVTAEHPGKVIMRTSVGGSRIVDMPTGEMLPRIC